MENTTEAANGGQVLRHVGDCLYRAHRSGIYYAIFRRNGKQIRRSLKTADREMARRTLENLRQKVTRLDTKSASNLLFADLAKRWLVTIDGSMKEQSFRRRETVVKMIKPHFRNTVRGIGKTEVENWASTRAKQIAPRTFNIERETVIQIFDYAMRHGLVLDNPARIVKRLKEPKAKITIPSKEQFKTLLEAIRANPFAQDAATLCELLAYSGCRLGEATEMTWGDVSFDAKSFTVTGGERGTKNHEARTVPLFPPFERFLTALRAKLTAPPSPADRILNVTKSYKAIAGACRRVQLPHFTHHSLRHFFCSNAIEAGIDFKVIAAWLGHKDGGVLVAKTYGHLRDEHSAAMAKKMTFDAN